MRYYYSGSGKRYIITSRTDEIKDTFSHFNNIIEKYGLISLFDFLHPIKVTLRLVASWTC